MHYVYVLLSKKDKNFYIGYSTDLRKRIKKHKQGKVTSTKGRRPLKLIFHEAYLNKKDAKRREEYFKTSKGKTSLKSMLKEYLKEADYNG